MERKTYRLTDIAARLGGRVLGDGDTAIYQVATLQSAQAGQLAFLASSKYRAQLATTNASAVIVGEADAETNSIPRIVCDNPYAYFAQVSAWMNPPRQYAPGVHPTAVIGEGAQIAPSAHIGAQVLIGAAARIGANSVIMAGCNIGDRTSVGDGVLLYPGVSVYHDCVLGNHLIAHSGVVIGADGFGIAWDEGRWLKIPQIGRVVIGDHVEIGANTTIDRGALDDTVIEDGVKLDNQIQVGHNVHIGAHTAIAACVAIAGSATIGRYCRIGGCTGILGHIQIADHVEVSSFTMIGKSIRVAGTYTGIFPFSSNQEWRKNAAQVRHLDEIAEKIKVLQQEIEVLKREDK